MADRATIANLPVLLAFESPAERGGGGGSGSRQAGEQGGRGSSRASGGVVESRIKSSRGLKGPLVVYSRSTDIFLSVEVKRWERKVGAASS